MFKVIERAIFRSDIRVIGDVVAAIPIGGWKMRREPDRIDAKADEVIEFRGDAGKIADAVAVTISEGTWVDLIKDSGLPPF